MLSHSGINREVFDRMPLPPLRTSWLWTTVQCRTSSVCSRGRRQIGRLSTSRNWTFALFAMQTFKFLGRFFGSFQPQKLDSGNVSDATASPLRCCSISLFDAGEDVVQYIYCNIHSGLYISPHSWFPYWPFGDGWGVSPFMDNIIYTVFILIQYLCFLCCFIPRNFSLRMVCFTLVTPQLSVYYELLWCFGTSNKWCTCEVLILSLKWSPLSGSGGDGPHAAPGISTGSVDRGEAGLINWSPSCGPWRVGLAMEVPHQPVLCGAPLTFSAFL